MLKRLGLVALCAIAATAALATPASAQHWRHGWGGPVVSFGYAPPPVVVVEGPGYASAPVYAAPRARVCRGAIYRDAYGQLVRGRDYYC